VFGGTNRHTVIIDGNEYYANDTGGGIKGFKVDLCVDTHKNALKLGKYYADVYIKTE